MSHNTQLYIPTGSSKFYEPKIIKISLLRTLGKNKFHSIKLSLFMSLNSVQKTCSKSQKKTTTLKMDVEDATIYIYNLS